MILSFFFSMFSFFEEVTAKVFLRVIAYEWEGEIVFFCNIALEEMEASNLKVIGYE